MTWAGSKRWRRGWRGRVRKSRMAPDEDSELGIEAEYQEAVRLHKR